MSEIEIQDAIIAHSLDLMRLAAHEQADAEAILRALEADLRALLATRTLSEAGKREVNALIAQAQDAIAARYAAAAQVVDTQALAIVIARQTVAAIGSDAVLPSAERLASLTRDVLIDGAPSSAWWEKQSEETAFKFAGQVRQGVVNGETNERIVSRIVGSSGEPGIMETARRNARALVHSSVQTAANDARMATYRKNGRFTDGVRWLATLDGHTCPQCAGLDGSAWDLDGEPIRGTTIAFTQAPAHFGCRCIMSPIPKSLDDVFPGIDAEFEAARTRASAQGPVRTTMAQYLRRAPRAQVEEQLGRGRAALFLSGKITIRDLVSGTGRPLSLDELQARI